ncbi:MAG TPA: ribonuclease P protein component [Rhodocyclaceae bacterium]|nr:ribonuclease P protein component [Rhodocyclaceae bacterium]
MTGRKQFRPEHRLRQPGEFSAVLSGRQRLRGEWFELCFGRPGGTSARLGLVIPKRLARRAVMRNLAKRLAREAFRDVRTQLPMMDLVLRLSRAATSTATRDLPKVWRREIDLLLSRLPK